MTTFLHLAKGLTLAAVIAMSALAALRYLEGTYADLVVAARRYWIVVGLAVLLVAEDVALIPSDGARWLLLSVPLLALAVCIAVGVDNRRDAKFEETVREWWSA